MMNVLIVFGLVVLVGKFIFYFMVIINCYFYKFDYKFMFYFGSLNIGIKI